MIYYKINNLFFYVSLAVLMFIFSCTDNGWNKTKYDQMISRCISKGVMEDKCECVTKTFISEFSYADYVKMNNESITIESNPQIYNRLDLHISSSIEKCGINF